MEKKLQVLQVCRTVVGVKLHFHQQFLVISWQSVLLVEETEVPGENNRPVASN
jgi:hypothetical protein